MFIIALEIGHPRTDKYDVKLEKPSEKDSVLAHLSQVNFRNFRKSIVFARKCRFEFEENVARDKHLIVLNSVHSKSSPEEITLYFLIKIAVIAFSDNSAPK